MPIEYWLRLKSPKVLQTNRQGGSVDGGKYNYTNPSTRDYRPAAFGEPPRAVGTRRPFLIENPHTLAGALQVAVQIRNTRIEFAMPVSRNRARLILAAARYDNRHIVFGRGLGEEGGA